jgi:aspartyl-tRNA(Asn)/glutamyl-tRNA(Gln) amidotransferase subunit C
MSLDRQQVAKIAYLARLSMTDAELDEMTQQLVKIVDLVDQLSEVNTDGVEPMVHAIELQNVLQEDEVKTSLLREKALANAPDADEECFRVSAVLG